MKQFNESPLLLRTVLEYCNAEPSPLSFENGFSLHLDSSKPLFLRDYIRDETTIFGVFTYFFPESIRPSPSRNAEATHYPDYGYTFCKHFKQSKLSLMFSYPLHSPNTIFPFPFPTSHQAQHSSDLTVSQFKELEICLGFVWA